MRPAGQAPNRFMPIDLAAEHVTKRFGQFTAVENVSFEVPQGHFFSILGPSGCGKTTLLRMIAGFTAPSEGLIAIRGEDMQGVAPNRRPVNLIFQHLALFPMMNVAQNIAFGLQRRGERRDVIERKVGRILERVGLPGFESKKIDQLSGGQQQRVAIARCLVLEPAVLLLDEPLGALDLKLREQMKVELKKLQAQVGTTFVYITHDQSEALVMSDHVAVMKDGVFEQVGTPQELYSRPRTAFVAGFVGDSNRWKGRVVESDSKGIKIETETGVLLVAAPGDDAGYAPGTAVEIFVRPEFISVSPSGKAAAAAEGVNVLSGTVDSLLFNGANSRVLVRSSADSLVEVDFPLNDESIELRPGEAVDLSWSQRRSTCFRAPE